MEKRGAYKENREKNLPLSTFRVSIFEAEETSITIHLENKFHIRSGRTALDAHN